VWIVGPPEPEPPGIWSRGACGGCEHPDSGWRAEVAHAVMHLGLIDAVRRLAPGRAEEVRTAHHRHDQAPPLGDGDPHPWTGRRRTERAPAGAVAPLDVRVPVIIGR